MLTEHLAQPGHTKLQLLLGGGALEQPGGEAQVHSGLGGEIGEGQRREGVVEVSDPLGERGLRHAGRPEGARQHDGGRGAVPLLAGHESREDFLDQQPPHFRGDSREHDHQASLGRVLDPQAGRGPARVGEHRRAARHLGLRAIDRGHGPAQPAKPRLECGEHARVERERALQQLRDDGFGHVVAGGAEAAGGEDGAGASQRVGDGVPDRGGPVGHGRAAHDLDAGRRQGAPQLRRVGIDQVPQHQLGADGDDFQLHPRPLRRAR